MRTSHAVEHTPIGDALQDNVPAKSEERLCKCGCGEALPPFVDRASRATRYLPGHAARVALQNFVVDEETGCWVWQGKPTKDGHGQVCIERTTKTAHRAMWEFVNGELPEGYTVHHTCPNKLCVNPDPAHNIPVPTGRHRSGHALEKWDKQKAEPDARIIGRQGRAS